MIDRPLTDAEQLAIAALHAVVSEDVAKMTPEEREAAMAPIKFEIRRRIKARAEEPREPRELCSMTADLAVDPVIEKLRSERDALRARCGELEADVDELRRSEELLRNDLIALADDRDELRRSVERLDGFRIRCADRDALHVDATRLRARVEELEVAILNQSAEPPPAYHAALEGLRAERDALRAEVMRLRRHLSPPPEVPDAVVDGGGTVPTYRERPSLGRVKPRPDLLPAEALLAAGECLADRTDRDVGSLPWFDRAPLAETLPKYRASLMRHVLAYYADDKVDPESSRPALAHVIVNASILYRLENRAITARQGTES